MKLTKVLVVEDEAIVAMDIAAQLEDLGYEVCATVDNGSAAINAVNQHRPDLVLMDVKIKGEMDGIETAIHLNKHFHTPIIFLTANNDAGTIARATNASPYGYLTKPFQPNGLGAVIEVALFKAGFDKKLRESEKWYSSILRCVADGVVATDIQGNIQLMNTAAESILEWSFEAAKDKHITDIIKLKDNQNGEALEVPAVTALSEKKVVDAQFGTLLITHEYVEVPLHMMAAPIMDEDAQLLGTVTVFRDVSVRVAAESQLLHMAQFDPLTGLANRYRLNEELPIQIMLANRLKTHFAVIYVDLDHFKEINDTLGHAAGDSLLQEVAKRLKSAVRETDFVARIGGDEFVLLLTNIQSTHDVPNLTKKIQDEFTRPVLIENKEIKAGLSLGVSFYPEDAQDAQALFKSADIALYQAKEDGRGNTRFYSNIFN